MTRVLPLPGQDTRHMCPGSATAARCSSVRSTDLSGRAQSFVAGAATNVQFMVKDSRKYAATGGWGFAQFKDGKPADEALLKTCFPCHEPVKARDFVFTHYAP